MSVEVNFKKNIVIGIALILLVAMVFFFILKDKGDDSNVDSSSGGETTYAIKSDENNVLGEITVKPFSTSDGSVTMSYVYILEDSLKNNGKCIDAGEPFCADDDGSMAQSESMKYHYALVLGGLVDRNDSPVGTFVEPVYCNKDALLSDPMSVSQLWSNPSGAIDIRCEGDYYYDTWQPTTTFVGRNGSTLKSIDDLLNAKTLNLYDDSSLYKIKYTTTANSGTSEQINPSLEESIADGVLVKTYSVTYEQQ